MTNTNRIDAIYARQSVDKKDSISIESQIEFCRHELRGGSAKEYQDKGFSGKNTDRPQFQQLVRDIEAGLIARVVVYKLDRISRSILDFANMMQLFQKHNVEFVSGTEKFDTSTPMGRAMLNICIVFAQLERETIQRRVADAYYSRSRKGFRMGKTPFGYTTEPFTIQGKATKRLIADPETADTVRLIYEMYGDPQTSFGDIARYLGANEILIRGKYICRTNIADILSNPVYTQADMDIYDFFKDNGAEIEGNPADFTGVTGCALFTKKDAERSRFAFSDRVLVPSPHEGLIPSDLWLRVRKKMLANHQYQPARKITQTWMAGKIKCGHCGYSLGSTTAASSKIRYLRCRQRVESKSCVGCQKLKTGDVEQLVYDSMVEKLREFKDVSSNGGNRNNPKLTAAKVELAQVEVEIEKLIESLMGANATLLSFANRKAEELESRKQLIMLEIADLSTAEIPTAKIDEITKYLNDWGNTGFDDKRQVVDSVISAIRATSENVEIEWKI
ncbi:MAG: recombinase family protein [Hungatella sp.]|jgi:DNA invertase Pin-like site-specific DNA recombinase|nr:recombinase family protein [Hungatella sp.]